MSETFDHNRRRTQRQVLCYYLKVIDLETGQELGRIADITSEGMMIFGSNLLDEKKTYRVRIIIEKSVFDISLGNLDVSTQIRWSKPDANPTLNLTGMLFLDLNERGRKIVENLVTKIGMSRNLDLAEEEDGENVY